MKFISFGCWNKGDPDNHHLPLLHILAKLNTRLETGDIDFVMITGDNFYYHAEEEAYIPTPHKSIENVPIQIGGSGKGGEDKGEDKNNPVCDMSLLRRTFDKLNAIGLAHGVPIYMCTGNHEYKEHDFVRTDGEDASPPALKPSEPYPLLQEQKIC
jgi:hypothetical protein